MTETATTAIPCTRGYCVRCCAYGRHWYGVERTSIDTERPCICACHGRRPADPAAALERVTQELAQLRYERAHEADREPLLVDALRLCRLVIVPEHCAECRAAATTADAVLALRNAERGPIC